ncbi:hypothetical protein [Pseudomonas chlororaphis]|uniref:hypothetical protein n=1 Tax=Pseudomonas chlororaphis TaxID=587753 RepID=UPI001B326832|nr:hypothetical protein [Pseudomonas chlororaphis]
MPGFAHAAAADAQVQAVAYPLNAAQLQDLVEALSPQKHYGIIHWMAFRSTLRVSEKCGVSFSLFSKS